ncbi:dolichyl-diphosphooligosaccharide--protein glycosyltransferase subunit 2-like [Bradysia coprophila]|uniref:dolichyl-diphosphooligosaccharide--protein glycosyltransferase subunit 2-like n=1 Tax=Bradysia coprophila TaxID=38358 RepID=UPI00187D85B8|nr:dolichyl-diphosphooligosaccharide--protein glycosyltransferase subunit 2-like [Bradysia coprophila]
MLNLGLFVVFCLSCFVLTESTKTIDSHLSSADLQRLNSVFTEALSSSDIQSIYYGALHIKDLQKKHADLCPIVTKIHKESKMNDFEKNFYLVNIYKKIACPTPIPESIQTAISLKKEFSNSQEMYFNYQSTKALGFQITDDTKADLVKNLQAIVRKDDSFASLGYAFHVAAELGTRGEPIAEWIEGAFAQADEVNGKMLQFEGGLSVTALVLNGAFKLTTALKKPAPLTEEQTYKFVTYLLSRREVQIAKGAHVLIEALTLISADKKISPICVQIVGNGQIQPDSPLIHVKIVDLLGNPVSPAVSSVSATVTAKQSSTALVTKQALTSKSSDKTVFELSLSAAKPVRGAYTVQIFADQYQQTVEIKILGKVKVKALEIGVGEVDSTSSFKKQTIDYPNKLSEELNADAQQKVLLRVTLIDETTGSPMTVHQAFIRLENKKSGEEIIFVAEQDTSKAYKFDMDVGARGVDFGHISGLYSMELIVGDASLSNSFKWYVADIQLKFSSQPKAVSNTPIRTLRPEIIHQFREPEKRPARLVSDLFTGLCIVPLVVLFILWSKLKVNVSDFPFTLSALGFHLGFGAILLLFCVFFWKLNMFETIRYLLPLALVTFFFGNRLLRSIAARKSS